MAHRGGVELGRLFHQTDASDEAILKLMIRTGENGDVEMKKDKEGKATRVNFDVAEYGCAFVNRALQDRAEAHTCHIIFGIDDAMKVVRGGGWKGEWEG